MINLHNAEFLLSAVSAQDFLKDGLPQIVFAGRSNVGKSSVINCLLNRKKLAYVGDSPGKTVHINYYLIDKKGYFVDLPGYGYARVSKQEKQRWAKLISDYFAGGTISFGVQIVDIRHKPTQDDIVMSRWFKQSNVPFIVVANKLDKIKKTEEDDQLSLIKETLELNDNQMILPFSAKTKWNRTVLLERILNTID